MFLKAKRIILKILPFLLILFNLPLNVYAEEDINNLIMAISVDPDGFDPQRTAANSTFLISNNIYDTLVTVDEEGRIIPSLAEEWSVSEDGLETIFKLRDDVCFHSGRPFTSQSIKDSFKRLLEPGSPRGSEYSNIVDIQVIDDYTIKFITDGYDAQLLSKLAYPWAAIVDVYEGDNLKTQPSGTGPYKLVEWSPQEKIVLEKFDHSPRKPQIPTVTLKMIPDAQSKILAMYTGEVHMGEIPADMVDLMDLLEGFNLIKYKSNRVQLMGMNLENEYLKDPNVRRAIVMGVDVDNLIGTVWYGLGDKIGSHYPTVLDDYVDYSDTISYDPEGARELLEKSGYGEGITLKLSLPKDYPTYVDAGQVIAHDLAKIGIHCEIEIVEWAYWLDQVYQNRNYDLTVIGHSGLLNPQQWLARYESDSAENYMNYKNERVDEILNTAPKIKDNDERQALYNELFKILANDVPALYIQSPIFSMAISDELDGFKAYPTDVYDFSDIYNK